MNRRALLSLVGAAVLGGCSGSGDESTTTTEMPTDVPLDDTETPTDSDPPRWLRSVTPTGWPTARGGPRRRGRAPNAGVEIGDRPQVRFGTSLGRRGSRLALTEYGIFARVDDDATAVFRRNPRISKRMPLPGAAPVSGLAIHDGTVYCGGSTGIQAIDATHGNRTWSSETGGIPFEDTTFDVPVGGTPAVADGRVYAVGLDSDGGDPALIAVDADSGDRNWTRAIAEKEADRMAVSPLVVDGTVYVSISQEDEQVLHAHDAVSGDRRWTYRVLGGGPPNASTPAAAGGMILFRTGDGRVHAVADGERRWVYDAGDPITGPLAIGSNRVYLVADGVHAVSLAAGEREWHASIPGRVRGHLALGDDAVFATGDLPPGDAPGVNGRAALHAIDRDSGNRRWSFDHDGEAGAPVVGKHAVFVPFHVIRHDVFTSLVALA